ncbi:MAG: GAF domain-containing protein [Chloroflexota bacterium]|nr:GAF domain-containing protein [Chloroflexota bacterium]
MPREKILAIERDSVIASVQPAVWERYEVAAAPSEEDAMELTKRERFDLLIADTSDFGGLRAVETARRRDPAIAVVLIGERHSVDAAFQVLPPGPQSPLIEPFTSIEMGRAIEDALERRRLVRDNKRLKALIPLFEISKTMMSEVDLSRLFDVILNIVWKETEADGVSLMLLDNGRKELAVKAAIGPLERRENGRERVGEGLAGWVAQAKRPLLLTEGDEIEPHLQVAMDKLKAFSVLCLPLVAKDSVIGVLRSSKARGLPFNVSDLEFTQILCGQAAIAIENASLFSGVRTEQARVERLLKQISQAREQERQRISMEIHDGAAQWMVAAYYRLQALDKLLARGSRYQEDNDVREIGNYIDQSIKELRRLIVDLHPPALAELGLLGAIRQHLQNLEQHTGIKYRLYVGGRPVALPSTLEIAIYRVAQESLTNVRKHAHATRVKATVHFGKGRVRMEIRDNGRGFDLCQALADARSAGKMGLSGMRDRVETLNGTLDIESSAGRGTTITVELPIPTAVPDEPCAVCQGQ